jgi:hypothetical protein
VMRNTKNSEWANNQSQKIQRQQNYEHLAHR